VVHPKKLGVESNNLLLMEITKFKENEEDEEEEEVLWRSPVVSQGQCSQAFLSSFV
jgi:hypothetical protein